MKKVLSFALMALTLGYVFVSCDEEKLTPEDEKKPTPTDTIQTTPKDTNQVTPTDTVPNVPADTVSYTLSISLEKADSIYLGTDTTISTGTYYRQDIIIEPFVLSHSFASWGFGEGFTYTSCSNDTTPGYSNLSAITKRGVKTNAYFTSNAGFWETPAEITFKDGKAYNAKECYVTNSTYAYLAIKNQNDGNATPYVKEWTDEDWFKLTITGYNDTVKTDTVQFLLADGLNIVNTWQKVDLTKLGKVTKIIFSLSSTDEAYGFMNTPAYFCLDQLTVTE